MAKKKLELEESHAKYHACMARANEALRADDLPSILSNATRAFDHADDMVHYAERFADEEVGELGAVAMTLRYAPAALRSGPLELARSLLRSSRRARRVLGDAADAQIANAFAQLRASYEVYRILEDSPGITVATIRDRLDTARTDVGVLLGDWSKFGVIVRQGLGDRAAVFLATRRGAMTTGRCPSCANVVDAPKAYLWADQQCDRCRQTAGFVLCT